MEAIEQAEGEKRVQNVLIAPLLTLGLAKPSTLTKAGFEVMLKELRQMLAYMSADNLVRLREEVEIRPGGKEGGRFPIALKIMKWAARNRTAGGWAVTFDARRVLGQAGSGRAG